MPKVFQNFDVYPQYLRRMHARLCTRDYKVIWKELLDDRFLALHMLLPILNGIDGAFAVGRDEPSQRSWAREFGLSSTASLDRILLAQIEESGADVFYNLDPIRFDNNFINKLPSNIKSSIAWRAAPSGRVDFGGYDRIVCNFESILQTYRDCGWNAGWFYPAFDPVMSEYRKRERSIDVVFVGTYSQHHQNRAKIVDAIALLQNKYAVNIHLRLSRLASIANTPLGLIPPLRSYRLPNSVLGCAMPSVFGRELYSILGNAKIVINGAIDMAGSDRGNMRCWESMGSEALMLSDVGNYPPYMQDGVNMASYRNADDMVNKVTWFLENETERKKIAKCGAAMLEKRYNKEQQWKDFVSLL
jgi:glycosyltransferase involved in cell wall biosynthesis